MTFNELKDEILTLGFNELPVTDAELAHHANRALMRIFSDRGVRARARLYIRPIAPHVIYSDVKKQRGAEISYTLGEGSCYICVCGEGHFRIEDDSGIRLFDFCADETVFKERLGRGAVIAFYGKYDYVIATLAAYSERFGSSADSIPEPHTENRVDLKKRIPDFASLVGLPTDSGGRPVRCLARGEDEVVLDEDFSGTLYISYRRLPRLISHASPTEDMDIDRELRPLLPLLCASYMLIECDSELSEFYEREYVARMKIIGRVSCPADNRYYDVNGW